MNNDLKTEEMCENWLIQQKAKIKKSTYANYCYLIKKLIEPELGKIDVMKLNKAYLEQLVWICRKENMRIVPFVLHCVF